MSLIFDLVETILLPVNISCFQGTLGILEEEFHIKDAVARITVELAKREWPQLWPSLQEDLFKLCQMGVIYEQL